MSRMKRPTYKAAIEWIAEEDAAGDNDCPEDISNYVSSCLVADLFDVTTEKVGQDVWRWRQNRPHSKAIRR